MITDVMSARTQWILGGSLLVRARPIYWDEYFNFNENMMLARLANRFGGRIFPQTSIFLGPTGSGKTTAARICGMIACCDMVTKQLKENPNERGLRPCGNCRACREFLTCEAHEDDGYRELNGSASDFEKRFEAAMCARHYSGWRGRRLLPMVIAVDEASGIEKSQWMEMHKIVEDTQHVSFIYIMRTAEQEEVTLPMFDRFHNTVYTFFPPKPEEVASGIVRLGSQLGFRIDLDAARLLTQYGQGSTRGVLDRLDETRDLWPDLTAAKIRERFLVRDDLM